MAASRPRRPAVARRCLSEGLCRKCKAEQPKAKREFESVSLPRAQAVNALRRAGVEWRQASTSSLRYRRSEQQREWPPRCQSGSRGFAALMSWPTCGITLELRRPRRVAAWPAVPMIDRAGTAGQVASRWGSALERLVRPQMWSGAAEGQADR